MYMYMYVNMSWRSWGRVPLQEALFSLKLHVDVCFECFALSCYVYIHVYLSGTLYNTCTCTRNEVIGFQDCSEDKGKSLLLLLAHIHCDYSVVANRVGCS